MQGWGRPPRAVLIAGLVLALAAPFVAYPVFLMKLLCWALLAASLNLLVGHVGLLSFGHAMFFGSSAYVTAHAMKVWGTEPLLGVLAGTACAAFVGLTGGLLAILFAMLTFIYVTSENPDPHRVAGVSCIMLACAYLLYCGKATQRWADELNDGERENASPIQE